MRVDLDAGVGHEPVIRPAGAADRPAVELVVIGERADAGDELVGGILGAGPAGIDLDIAAGDRRCRGRPAPCRGRGLQIGGVCCCSRPRSPPRQFREKCFSRSTPELRASKRCCDPSGCRRFDAVTLRQQAEKMRQDRCVFQPCRVPSRSLRVLVAGLEGRRPGLSASPTGYRHPAPRSRSPMPRRPGTKGLRWIDTAPACNDGRGLACGIRTAPGLLSSHP